MAGRRRFVAVAITATLMAVPAVASAGPVRPDPSFGGGDGYALGNVVDGPDHAWAVAVQDDGKIVLAGEVLFENRKHFVLLRFTRHGAIDRAWGQDGLVVTNFGTPNARATGVAIDHEDDQIVAVGTAWGPDRGTIAIARYNEEGRLAQRFGDGDGRVQLNVSETYDEGRDVVIDHDGRIVVVAQARGSDLAAVRLHPDGRRDRTFSDDGTVIVDVHRRDSAQAVLVDRRDRVLLGGIAGYASDQNARYGLVRLREDGTRDPAFGDHGIVTTQLSPQADFLVDMDLDNEGRIVAAGGTGPGGYGAFSIVRYLPDGRLDRSFGGDGKVIDDVTDGLDQAAGVVVRGDRIYVSGDVGVDREGTTGNIGMLRYAEGGARNSRSILSISKYWDVATGTALQPGEGVLVAGGAYGLSTFTVVRFIG